MDIFRWQCRQYDPGTLAMAAMVGTTAISAAGSIYGGQQQQQNSNAEATLQEQQGNIALDEAKTNATNEAFNQTQAVQNQRMAFLANGVTLEGSPSMVLAQSKKYGQSQVDALLKQGQARKDLAYQQASITRNTGRAAMLSGILQATSTVGKSTSDLNQAGAFDPKAIA